MSVFSWSVPGRLVRTGLFRRHCADLSFLEYLDEFSEKE